MDEKKYLQLEYLDCYRTAADLSQYVWQCVRRWDRFAQDTIGKQFVRAVDSISSNIAEGFGRFHKKDKILFYKYSYGSVSESTDWNEKGRKRQLLSAEEHEHIKNELQKLPKSIHQLIQYTDRKLKL